MKRERGKSLHLRFKNDNITVPCYRSANSVDTSDLNEASVASITISNESLAKSGESIIVSGKGMGSTVKVKMLLELRLKDIY